VLALDAATGETQWERTTTPAGEYVINYPTTVVEGEVWSSWWNGDPDGCEFATVRLDRDGAVVGTDRSAFPWSSAVQSGRHLVQTLGPRCPTATDWPPALLTVRDSRTLETLWSADVGLGTISGGQILSSEFLPLAGCGAPTCTSGVRPERTSAADPAYVSRPGKDVFGVEAGFAGLGGGIFALSRTDGALVWGAPIRSLAASLAADDDHLYVATRSGGPWSGRLLTFDIDGCGGPTCQPLWSAPAAPDGGNTWAPTVAGDVVYVAADDNTIRAFPAGGCGDPTCEEIGRVTLEGRITAMSVAEGRLFVASEVTPGSVYRVTAFEP
jgi:outer membrane protein assembly factor BamB